MPVGKETSMERNGKGGTNRPGVTNKTYLIQYFTNKIVIIQSVYICGPQQSDLTA